MRATSERLAHVTGCGWYRAWALVGAGFGFGISVIGMFTIPVAVVAVVFMARRRPVRGAWGVATGAGSVLLLVAYLAERDGSYNPVHWVIPGVVLVVGGIVAHALTTPE